MMINRVFIDLIETLKSIKNSKKHFKKIRSRWNADVAFTKIEDLITSWQEIKPEYLADFVVFLDLAESAGLFDNKSSDTMDLSFDLKSGKHLLLKATVHSKNNTDYQYIFDSVVGMQPWSIICTCNEIHSGFGITGDTIGEYSNTTVIVDREKMLSVPVIDNEYLGDKKDYIEKSLGYILTRSMLVSTCIIFSNLWDKINNGEYIFNV